MEITSGQPAISVGGGNGGPGPFAAAPLPPFPAVAF